MRDAAVRTGIWKQMMCQGRSTEIQNEAQRYFWLDASSLWRCASKYKCVKMGMCAFGPEMAREREREGACRQTAVFTDIETQGCYWQMKAWFVLSIIQSSF